MRPLILAIVLAAAGASSLFFCVATAHHVENSVPDVAAKDPRLTTLVKLLTDSGATVSYTRRSLSIDGAKAVRRDVRAANGIIHVIDTVLLPAGFE